MPTRRKRFERRVKRQVRIPWRSRRGLFLMGVATLLFAYGWSLFAAQSIPTSTLRNLSYAFALMGVRAWAWTWIAAAFATLLGSFCRWDRVGFAVSQYLLTAWTAFYLIRWIEGGAPQTRPWLSVALYGSVAFLIFVASNWDDSASHTAYKSIGRGAE